MSFEDMYEEVKGKIHICENTIKTLEKQIVSNNPNVNKEETMEFFVNTSRKLHYLEDLEQSLENIITLKERGF